MRVLIDAHAWRHGQVAFGRFQRAIDEVMALELLRQQYGIGTGNVAVSYSGASRALGVALEMTRGWVLEHHSGLNVAQQVDHAGLFRPHAVSVIIPRGVVRDWPLALWAQSAGIPVYYHESSVPRLSRRRAGQLLRRATRHAKTRADARNQGEAVARDGRRAGPG